MLICIYSEVAFVFLITEPSTVQTGGSVEEREAMLENTSHKLFHLLGVSTDGQYLNTTTLQIYICYYKLTVKYYQLPLVSVAE